ncbi:PREDICTED: cadherin-13-like, partial [Nestor notabilis]|uniref:cadherin-13-like n=1 Tax=Nestor notabilis TaxID=176057 RepID=UPI00052357CA
VLMLACADLECVPGFQKKAFYIEEPFQFIEDQPVLKMKFDDCKGNNKLTFEVSNPNFKVEHDGTLVALKNMSEAGRALFVHAQSEHAEDMAEILLVEENEKHSALKEILKIESNLGFPRQKRAILASPVLVPENQRGPFPKSVGKVISSLAGEGVRFRLSGKGVDQDPKGIFKINEITGDISVTRVLDREATASYE